MALAVLTQLDRVDVRLRKSWTGLRGMAKGNFDGAIESFTRAIELDQIRKRGVHPVKRKLNLTMTDNDSTSETIVMIRLRPAYSNGLRGSGKEIWGRLGTVTAR